MPRKHPRKSLTKKNYQLKNIIKNKQKKWWNLDPYVFLFVLVSSFCSFFFFLFPDHYYSTLLLFFFFFSAFLSFSFFQIWCDVVPRLVTDQCGISGVCTWWVNFSAGYIVCGVGFQVNLKPNWDWMWILSLLTFSSHSLNLGIEFEANLGFVVFVLDFWQIWEGISWVREMKFFWVCL